MQPQPSTTQSDLAQCPRPIGTASGRVLEADEELVMPLHRRVITHYTVDGDGRRTLQLYCGDKEVSFDEPELFAFGEALGRQDRFLAASAMGWAAGQDWNRVRRLLEALIEQGVLFREAEVPPQIAGRDGGQRASPLLPALTREARSWLDCEQVMHDLTGRRLALGHLELVVPIFRVAHMALDADGRQVGESNVFPPALRLDVPTRWRACIYAGSRHQSERPMNVTALKTMRAHWGEMMALILRVRTAYLARFPDACDGWTVAHVERLSVAVLGLPTYQVMLAPDRPLHPALSSLFRVTDGVRMTMHQMLFVPIAEPTLASDTPIDSAEIFAYADRNYAFHSEHGVCAGPQAMIEEFLGVLVDGRVPKEGLPSSLDPALDDALEALEPAIDYALLGLKVYAAAFSAWPLMTRAYASIARVAEDWAAEGSPVAATLAARFARHLAQMQENSYLGIEAWRVERERVYADMYAQCSRGVDGAFRGLGLDARLVANEGREHGEARATLRTKLIAHFAADTQANTAHLDRLVDRLMTFFLQMQAVLDVASEAQTEVNRCLGRSEPTTLFAAADLDLHNHLRGDRERRLPWLIDELAEVFELHIEIDRESVRISSHQDLAPADRAGAHPIRVASSHPERVHSARST